MMRCAAAALLLLTCWTASCVANTGAADLGAGFIVYRGMSDASAAVAVDHHTFIAADDETNALRVYRVAEPGPPVASHDLARFLHIDPDHPEADIEGAARLGDRVYWITSHGRNKDGKPRPNRYRFFATAVRAAPAGVEVHGVGAPYGRLVEALVAADAAWGLGLARVTRLHGGRLDEDTEEALAPKEQGLNIEGLCPSPGGETLYLGLRNPQVLADDAPGRRAVVIPLRNPAAVVETGAAPEFGAPLLWDLGGLGIRSMTCADRHEAVLIVAGPHDDRPGFSLFRWSGRRDAPPVFVRRLDADGPPWQPEALVAMPGSGRLLALSDDGGIRVPVGSPAECLEGEYNSGGTCRNKHLRDLGRRFFRARWIAP